MTEKVSRKRTFAYILVGAAGLGMTFLGVPLVSNNTANDVASVGKTKITVEQLRQAISQAQQQFPQTPYEQLQQSALDGLIDQTVLQNHAIDSGYKISDSALYDVVKRQFGDETAYQSFLNANYMTAKQYQAGLQNQLINQNYYQFLDAATITTQIDIETLIKLLGQQRDMTVISLPVAKKAASLNVTDAEIKNYYDNHHDQFMSEENVDLKYFILNADSLVSPQSITAEQIAEEKSTLEKNIKRAGEYIIFDNQSEAEKAGKALSDGSETFASLAKAIQDKSISGQTGTLDLHIKGEGASKKADDALFALDKVDDVSPIFTTEYGDMLVKATEIQTAEIPDEATLRQNIAQNLGEKRYSDLANSAFDKVQNGATIDEIAELAGVPIETLNNVTVADKKASWLQDPKISGILFGASSIAVNQIAQPIELNDTSSVFYAVSKRVQPALLPLENIKANVEQAYRQAEAIQLLTTDAKAIQAALNEGKPYQALVDKNSGQVQSVNNLNRFELPNNIPQSWLAALLAQTDSVAIDDTSNRDAVLIAKIDKITDGTKENLPKDFLFNLQTQVSNDQQFTNIQSIANWLRSDTKIKINQNQLSSNNN